MKSRKPYADKFKQEAVKLILEQGMTASQVARDLGVGLDTLRRWLRAARPVTNPTNDVSTPNAELTRLRREVEQLRMEREILKSTRHLLASAPVIQ
jgi:transposase